MCSSLCISSLDRFSGTLASRQRLHMMMHPDVKSGDGTFENVGIELICDIPMQRMSFQVKTLMPAVERQFYQVKSLASS